MFTFPRQANSVKCLLNIANRTGPGIGASHWLRQAGNALLRLLSACITSLGYHKPGFALMGSLEYMQISYIGVLPDEVRRSTSAMGAQYLQHIPTRWLSPIPAGTTCARGGNR